MYSLSEAGRDSSGKGVKRHFTPPSNILLETFHTYNKLKRKNCIVNSVQVCLSYKNNLIWFSLVHSAQWSSDRGILFFLNSMYLNGTFLSNLNSLYLLSQQMKAHAVYF